MPRDGWEGAGARERACHRDERAGRALDRVCRGGHGAAEGVLGGRRVGACWVCFGFAGDWGGGGEGEDGGVALGDEGAD